jgi:hypothetical protein
MEPDKRRYTRKRTDQLLYAELGPDNGSILLNLCQEGCSFQSMAPVRGQNVRFAVSVGDGRKLEGDGLMIWSDPIKKTGGLRFLSPSPALQDQIREWLDATVVTADGKLDPAAVESQAKRRRKQLREEARLEAARARREGQRKAPTEASIETKMQEPQHVNRQETPNRVSPRETLDASTYMARRPPSGKNWWGLATMVLLAFLFLALISFRRELGHLVIWFGSNLAGEEEPAQQKAAVRDQPAASSNAPAEAQAATPPDSPIAKDASMESIPSSNAQAAQPTLQQSESAKHGSAPLDGATGDVAALWNAVENGDTQAEVTLADRYIRGEGVPRSCAQARVLLEAAVKRGSAEAKQKLGALASVGCP